MNRLRLYPYPRLAGGDVSWSRWSIRLDGDPVAAEDIADQWDSNSTISVELSARAGSAALERLGVGSPRLSLTVACADTALSAFVDAPFVGGGDFSEAAATLEISGRRIAQALDLRADIIGADASAAWLSRRIIAEGPQVRVPLDSDLVGFPTSSSSFEGRGLLPAPWRINVLADSLEAPFVHSIRLELNEDYPAIRRLISGKPDAATDAELSASITRVLIATASRLWADGDAKLEDIAAEHPDSIAAAAQRAALQQVGQSLSAAVSRYRLRPESLEYEIASRQRILRG